MAYWLVKTEPESYGYADLVRLGRDRWNGVRNPVANRYLRAMKPGDGVFVYHTGKEKSVVGVAEVVSLPYPDPEADSGRWTVVDMEPRYLLAHPVTLREVKAEPTFGEWALVRQPRLSVMPVPEEIWRMLHIMAGEAKAPVSF